MRDPAWRDSPTQWGRESHRLVKERCTLAGVAACRHRAAMKVRVYVTLKKGVLDPQGKAIHHALEGLGFSGVHDVRAGKLIELDVDDGTSDGDVEEMCRKLLA